MDDEKLIAARFLLPLRPGISPLVEIKDKVSGCTTFAPVISVQRVDSPAIAQAGASPFWHGSFDGAGWQQAVSDLAAAFQAEGRRMTVLYETVAEYLRTVLLEAADEYRVAMNCDRWLLMYEHIVAVATAHPGVITFVRLQDMVATAGGCEMSLDEAKGKKAGQAAAGGAGAIGFGNDRRSGLRGTDAALRELRPATATSLHEVQALMHRRIPKDTLARIGRIEACCRRAVYNRRALALSHDLRYSNAVVRHLDLDFGGEGAAAGGVLIKNPAFYGGKPILEFDGRRWLAHAPSPHAGASEFIFPFLLLSGHYRLFMNVVGRDRRARPLDLGVELVNSQTGEILRRWVERIQDGRNVFLNREFVAEGEYNISISIAVGDGSPDNYFSSVWIGDASLLQTGTRTSAAMAGVSARAQAARPSLSKQEA